ncbi:MAG: asparagine synthetase A [Candidatus Aminicenantia bacterium]
MGKLDLKKIHPFMIDKALLEKREKASKVLSEVLSSSSSFLKERGFVEILPVIISPITDPLADPSRGLKFEIYGYPFELTKSMIFHKQISVLQIPKIFTFSPNVRIEPPERKDSGRHLLEFTQLDLEVRWAKRDEIMELGEELLIHVMKSIKERCKDELEFFGRELKIPEKPFPKITWEEAVRIYGNDFEIPLSKDNRTPVWVIDFPVFEREFYDREWEDREGYNADMDLIYPEGFGEAISGGEREWKYDRIFSKIKRKGLSVESFDFYLRIAKEGLSPSAGFGIGVERLVRFLAGLKSVSEVKLFPKLPGEFSI